MGWNPVTDIRGPQGVQGIQGIQGVKGDKGDPGDPATATTNASELTSGTVAYARLPVGTTASTVAAGNDLRLSDARTPTAHVHAAGDITSGLLSPARIPNVLHPPITASGTGAYTVDASAGTDWYLTATGDRTLTISGGADGQMIVIDVLASGGARSITINSVTLTTGMVNPYPIASGKVGTIGIRRTNGVWRVLAQTVNL